MEMGSVKENHQVDFDEDEPEIFPRVGDKYQAEIPPLSATSFYDGIINHTTSDPSEFLMGLPIPVMRLYEEVETTKHDSEVAFDVANKYGSLKFKCVEQIQHANSKLCAEPMDIKSDHRMISSKTVKLGLKQKKMSKMPEKLKLKQYSLVPGSSVDNWSDIEKYSFLLGLFIFGKNLVKVKQFIGSKQMGDILSFYYREFYRSCSYIRWNKCKRVLGERLFTGSRQKVLLSRLLLHMSEEDQTTLVEVSGTFQKKRILLEEYVFIIKAKVGLSAFVQAVGIGKEKQDLTATMTPTGRSKTRKKRGTNKVPQAELRRDKKLCSGSSAINSELKEYAVIVHAVPRNSQSMDALVHQAEGRAFSLPAPNSNDIVIVEDSEAGEETVESRADTGPMITPEAEIPDQVAEDIPILNPSVEAGGINPESAQATDQINPLPSAEPQTPISHQALRATSPSGPALSTCENRRLILDQPEVRESAHVRSARNRFRTHKRPREDPGQIVMGELGVASSSGSAALPAPSLALLRPPSPPPLPPSGPFLKRKKVKELIDEEGVKDEKFARRFLSCLKDVELDKIQVLSATPAENRSKAFEMIIRAAYNLFLVDDTEEAEASELKQRVVELTSHVKVLEVDKAKLMKEKEKLETALQKKETELEKALDRVHQLEESNSQLLNQFHDEEKKSSSLLDRAVEAEAKGQELMTEMAELKVRQREVADLTPEEKKKVIAEWKAGPDYDAFYLETYEEAVLDCCKEWTLAGYLDVAKMKADVGATEQEEGGETDTDE